MEHFSIVQRKTKKKKIKMAQVEHSNTQQNPKKAGSSHINRDDFDGGPVSVDEIEKGLFLGLLFFCYHFHLVYKS